MPPLSVVEDLKVLEDGVGQLQTGSPAPSIQEFDLHSRPERPDDGVDAPIGQVVAWAAGWRARWSVMTRW